MKRKLTFWFLALGMAASFALPQSAGASGACTAARFHDWNDMGCNQNNAGAGGVPKAKCPACPGMPQWWVSEPYINLCLEDTPLSYALSSGQEMAFRFYYRQRTKLPGSDEVAGPNFTYIQDIPSRYPITQASTCGTNAAWNHNWAECVVLWDNTWEQNWRSSPGPPGHYYYYPPTYAVFSQGYQAFVFRPEGGVNYYSVPSYAQSARDPASLVVLQAVSSGGYPLVTENFGLGGISNAPTVDSNGIYWGDPNVGVRLVYSDGSQAVFGLSANPVISGSTSGTISPPPQMVGKSTVQLLLTQRIDPAGRVTKVGYEPVYLGLGSTRVCFRVRYVVDPDLRTNVFWYVDHDGGHTNNFQLTEIDDPYGRKTQIAYSTLYGGNLAPSSIVDAAGMTNSFTYQGANGWITNLTTPYGNTSFSYYQMLDPAASQPDCFLQRAICVSEPEGARQLFAYEQFNSLIPSTGTAPGDISGQSFDDGNSGGTEYLSLQYRNIYHWGRRQFAALSANVQSALPGNVSNALVNLTGEDYNKADLKHWLLTSDSTDAASSITESISSEQDPSPDAAGQIPGLRTWYNYSGKPPGERLGSNPQVSCVARILPDGTSQYTTYNYYSSYPSGNGLVSDNEYTYSKPDGSIGLLTNRFTYAANGIDLASVSNSFGQWLNFGYNNGHQVKFVTNAISQVTILSWDEGNTWNLNGVQFPAGKSIGLSYYATSTPPTSTSAMISQITVQPEGRVFNINDYQAGNPSKIADDRGVSVTNSWDGLNRLTGTTFPDGSSISNVYYRLDRVAAKDRLGNRTLFGYDGLQHLTVITNANLAAAFLDWCGCGSLNHIYDAQNGTSHPTTLNYDNQGNLTNIIFPDSTSLTYQYDLAGRMFNAYDGAGKSLQFGYNNQGLVTNVIGAYGTLQSATYDALNRPIRVTDANGVTVTNTYDAINELLSRKWADGIGEGFGYSAAGLIAYTNRDGQFTHYGLDNAGRVTSVTNANTEFIQLGYDSLDNVNSLIDGLLHQTTWQYNEYGWLTNKVDGLNRNAFQFAYNANGWVTNRWTPEKGNTGYTYDNVGNLKTINYPLSTINYSYDALNRLTNVVNGFFTNSFAYTPAGQLAVEAGPWPNDTVSNSYSQLLRMSLNQLQPSGSWAQTSYGYDSVWRLQNLTSPAGGFSYTFNGGVSPLVKTVSLPNTAWITNHYDSLAQLDYTALANSSGHALDGYSYLRDALGLRTNVTRDFGLMKSSAGAGYDKIGQITSWVGRETNGTSRLNEQLGFGYDAADNLHLRTNNALVQTFSVDAANELTGLSRSGTLTVSGNTPAPAGSVTVNGQAAQTYADFTFARANNTLANGQNNFTNVAINPYGLRATNILTVNLPVSATLLYDNNGNLTNDGTRSFAYDSENELTNVLVTGQWKTAFIYDGLGRRRIAQDFAWQGGGWVKTNEVRYVFDGYLPIQERDSNNVVQVTYTRGLDLSGSIQGAGGIGGLLARTDSSGSTFYHADGAGNITGLMDGNQYMVGRYMYDPFGKLIGKWGSMADANVMRFSSMPFYRNPGIVGYSARFYEPNFSGFLNQDPIQENGGINLYGFVGNNPVNRVDPLGLDYYFGGNPGNSTFDMGHFWVAVDLPGGGVLKYDYGMAGYNGPNGSSGQLENALRALHAPGRATATPHKSICDAAGKDKFYRFGESPEADAAMAQRMRDSAANPADYGLLCNNCGNQSFDMAGGNWPNLAPLNPMPSAFLNTANQQWNQTYNSPPMNTYANSIPVVSIH